jgi:predicted enzyme related to lactoylglutathione lyase
VVDATGVDGELPRPDLDAMLAQLRAAGAQVDDNIEEYDYGRFGCATDPEGNRFELWGQPI